MERIPRYVQVLEAVKRVGSLPGEPEEQLRKRKQIGESDQGGNHEVHRMPNSGYKIV